MSMDTLMDTCVLHTLMVTHVPGHTDGHTCLYVPLWPLGASSSFNSFFFLSHCCKTHSRFSLSRKNLTWTRNQVESRRTGRGLELGAWEVSPSLSHALGVLAEELFYFSVLCFPLFYPGSGFPS